MDDLQPLTALELAARLRDGLSAEAACAYYLGRIARENGELQAFVSVFGERALATARKKDTLRARGGPLPPFHGVPIGVKDLNMARGSFARMGSRAWRYLWTPFDDLTVAALRRAGFVLLGKLATSELALMPVVETDLHPPTRNPWRRSHSSGGSSGGSASAVAGGLLPIAQGSDGGGSIRIPSGFCHLFGFKPSRGRVPNPHLSVDRLAASAIGPLARSVDDAAALLDALSGRDPEAPGSFLVASRPPPRRLRIAMVVDAPLGETHPEAAAATRAAADRLRALGHTIEERGPVAITLDEFLPVYGRMAADAPVLLESKLQPVTRFLRALGRRHTRESIRQRFDDLAARVRAWMGDADAMLTPTSPVLAPRVEEFRDLPPEEAFRAAAPIGAFTAAWNVAGHPAASLPLAFSQSGLPIGVQLVGRMGEDELVLALARTLETADWRKRPGE